MANTRREREAGKDHDNGFRPGVTTAVLEADYDEVAVAPEPAPRISITPEKTLEIVQKALGSSHFRITYEVDAKGRSGIIIWNVTTGDRQRITTALARVMSFQVGSYVEKSSIGESDEDLGMVIFVKSIKGIGDIR